MLTQDEIFVVLYRYSGRGHSVLETAQAMKISANAVIIKTEHAWGKLRALAARCHFCEPNSPEPHALCPDHAGCA